MIERGPPVAARQVESRCAGCDALRDLGSALESTVDDLGGNLPHHAWLNVVGEKVGDHAGRSGHGQAGENDPISSGNLAAVQANIAAPRLAASWERELMHVCPKVSDPVEARSRRMRDDGVVGIVEAGPGGRLGNKLKPGSPQPEMIGCPGAANAKDAVRYSLQPTVRRQTGQRRMANSRLLRLTSRDQSPLTLRNLG